MENIEKFCKIVKYRSSINNSSIEVLLKNNLYENVVAILRMELDSMIRCIYLLNLNSTDESGNLAFQTLSGKQWRIKGKKVYDFEMVDIANDLKGWTKYVYKMGCGFVHLSNFFAYEDYDPFTYLSEEEKHDIINFMRQYHNSNFNELSFTNLIPHLEFIYIKIRNNLNHYVELLEKNGSLKILE